MIVIAIAAVICGADGWVAVAQFGRSKEAWLREFLALPNGIPSHDTFGRVFSLLQPEAFEDCFRSWVASIREVRKRAKTGTYHEYRRRREAGPGSFLARRLG